MMHPVPVPENPYGNLYIYYLSGKFGSDNRFDPATYIGNWEEGDFSFLFFTRPSKNLVEKAIDGKTSLQLLDHYHMTYDQWHGDEIVPIRIGDFTITPPWYETGNGICDKTIILDPGVVFGTGTHPTTRDCLEALHLAFEDRTVRTALDLGTGTGLLALAATKSGCRKVLATDLNFLAVQTTLRNVHLNNLSNQILVAQGDAEKFMDFTFDLVVSNIHYDVMKDLIQTKGFLKKKRFILSGLMHSEAECIASELALLPLRIIQRWDQDGIWHTFFGACEQG